MISRADNEPETGGNRVGRWSNTEMSALGQKQTCAAQKSMSALPPKADMCSATRHVCFVPMERTRSQLALATLLRAIRSATKRICCCLRSSFDMRYDFELVAP